MTTVCPVCASSQARPAWRYREYPIWACPVCALEFVVPMQGAPVSYYQARYTPAVAAALADDVHVGFRYTVDTFRRLTEQYLTPGQRRAVDIGCGPGYFLAQLKKLGFDCLGLDFNPDVVRVANEHYHVNARVGRVEDLITLAARFDLALLIHVLEHVENPLGLLADIRQILDPGGLLFVELPNRDRLAVKRSLRRGQLVDGEYPPHHLTFWSARALTQALQRAGYDVLECRPRPFASENQIELFLRNRLRFPAGPATTLPAGLLRGLGRGLGLQSEVLFAVARRKA